MNLNKNKAPPTPVPDVTAAKTKKRGILHIKYVLLGVSTSLLFIVISLGLVDILNEAITTTLSIISPPTKYRPIAIPEEILAALAALALIVGVSVQVLIRNLSKSHREQSKIPQEQIESLREQNESLRAQVENLRKQNESPQQQIESLREQNESLQEQIESQREQNESLRGQTIRWLITEFRYVIQISIICIALVVIYSGGDGPNITIQLPAVFSNNTIALSDLFDVKLLGGFALGVVVMASPRIRKIFWKLVKNIFKF